MEEICADTARLRISNGLCKVPGESVVKFLLFLMFNIKEAIKVMPYLTKGAKHEKLSPKKKKRSKKTSPKKSHHSHKKTATASGSEESASSSSSSESVADGDDVVSDDAPNYEEQFFTKAGDRLTRATDAVLSSLFILSASNMPKNIYLEDVITLNVYFVAHQLTRGIFTYFDPLYKLKQESVFVATGIHFLLFPYDPLLQLLFMTV